MIFGTFFIIILEVGFRLAVHQELWSTKCFYKFLFFSIVLLKKQTKKSFYYLVFQMKRHYLTQPLRELWEMFVFV